MKRCMMIALLSLGCTTHALQKIKQKGKIDTNCKNPRYREKAFELNTEQDLKRYLNEKVAVIQKNAQLIVAVWHKKLQKVQTLIQQGANVNAEIENGRDDVAGVPVWCWRLFTARDAQDKQILTALLTDDVECVECYRDGNGNTPFICAAILGHLDVAKFLYKKGADINAKDNSGLTALWHWVHKNNGEAVDFLLSCPKIHIGVKNEKQESLLEYTVTHDMPEIVDALLWSSAAKQYISQEEKDALLKKVMCEKNRRMMQILIISGARYRPACKQAYETTLIVPRPMKVTDFVITDIEDAEETEKRSLLEAPLTTSSDSSHDSIVEPCDDIDKAFTSIAQ